VKRVNLGPHVRRGVAEFLSDHANRYRRLDVSVTLSGECWAKPYLNRTDLPSLIMAGEATLPKGDVETAAALLDILDPLAP
jgi:hypothetical protein